MQGSLPVAVLFVIAQALSSPEAFSYRKKSRGFLPSRIGGKQYTALPH
jgi:hypothetical protein